MANKFVQLYLTKKNLYTESSPVVIEAGAILMNTETNRVLAQFKFKNIATKSIKALFIDVDTFDIAGEQLEGIEGYQYLDLNIIKNQEFGTQQAVHLPNSNTRKIVCHCKKVIFTDGSEWTSESDSVWSSMKVLQERISFDDQEMEKQFRIKYGNDVQFKPFKYKDLYFCPCGMINKISDAKCSRCGRDFEWFENVDYEELAKEKNERLEKEKKEKAAKDAAREAAYEKAKRRAALGAKFVIPAVALVIILVIVFNVIVPNIKYSNAVDLYNAGNYEEAHNKFEELGDFKDSQDKKEEIIRKMELANVKVGDIVTLGSFENKDIKWIVWEKKDDKVLLFANESITKKCFDENGSNIWEKSSIRKWLNSDFYDTAFSNAEKNIILETELKTKNYTPPENRYGSFSLTEYKKIELEPISTKDKVFLPEYDEIDKTKTGDSYLLRSSLSYDCIVTATEEGARRGVVDSKKRIDYSLIVMVNKTITSILPESQSYVRPAMWISTK